MPTVWCDNFAATVFPTYRASGAPSNSLGPKHHGSRSRDRLGSCAQDSKPVSFLGRWKVLTFFCLMCSMLDTGTCNELKRHVAGRSNPQDDRRLLLTRGSCFLARISWHIQYNRPSHISNIYKHIAIITREVWPPIIRRTPRGRHRQTGEICHTFQGRALKGIHQPGAKNGLRPHVVSLAWKTPKENDFPLLSITLSIYIYISILTRSNVRFPIGVIGKGITAK